MTTMAAVMFANCLGKGSVNWALVPIGGGGGFPPPPLSSVHTDDDNCNNNDQG